MNIQETSTGYIHTEEDAKCPCTDGKFLGSYMLSSQEVHSAAELEEMEKAGGDPFYTYDVCLACGNVIGIM